MQKGKRTCMNPQNLNRGIVSLQWEIFVNGVSILETKACTAVDGSLDISISRILIPHVV